MYRQHNIAVVVPVHNEETLIANTIRSIPDFVDLIVLVDDGSSDNTYYTIAQSYYPKVRLIKHRKNRGVGAATVSGYRAAAAWGAEIVAVMDGDGQMHPGDLSNLLDEIILRGADYAKGNRFLHPSIVYMPRLRYLGNRVLSLLMRLALGIKLPLDAQCGYSAITSRAIAILELEKLYPRYGFLNELLFCLTTLKLKIASVPVQTIYGEEISGINPFVTVPTILYLITNGYLRRLMVTNRAAKQISEESRPVEVEYYR
ncbi:MAG: glycosyltransferase family 2 protein [Acidobacteriota bacterium]